MLGMLLGALIFALGLTSGVLLCKHPKPASPAKDKFAKYRDPATGLLSTRMVEKQKGESKGR